MVLSRYCDLGEGAPYDIGRDTAEWFTCRNARVNKAYWSLSYYGTFIRESLMTRMLSDLEKITGSIESGESGTAMNSQRVESVEEFNKPGLASIFDPAITDGRVDGCQLNLSVTQPVDTYHINLYSHRATRGFTRRRK